MTAFRHHGPGTRAAAFSARLRGRLRRVRSRVARPRLVLRRLVGVPPTLAPISAASPAPRTPAGRWNVQVRVAPRLVVNVAHRHEAAGAGRFVPVSSAVAGPAGRPGPAGAAGSPGVPAHAQAERLAPTVAVPRRVGTSAARAGTTDPVVRPRRDPLPMSVVAAERAPLPAHPAPAAATSAAPSPPLWAPDPAATPRGPDIGPLTDQVISAIDRRIVAQRERLGSA